MDYRKPTIVSLTAAEVLGALGAASCGSGGGPMGQEGGGSLQMAWIEQRRAASR